MFGSQVLDIGIGLATLFAFMSLVATSLNEAIETFLKARAKQLEQGIRNILGDPDGTKKIAHEFYNSPFITILYSGKYEGKIKGDNLLTWSASPSDSARTNSVPIMSRGGLPSYIPAANFALAALHIVAGGKVSNASDVEDGLKKKLEDVSPALTKTFNEAKTLAAQVKKGDVKVTTKAAAIVEKTDAAAGMQLGDTDLGKLVTQALLITGNDLEKTRKYLEDWYDSSMDRITGWYKQRTQKILFCIGLFAAIVLNVDSIQVGRSLMYEPAMRQALIARAGAFAKPNNLTGAEATNPAPMDPVKELAAMGLPIGWARLPQLQDSTCIDLQSCKAAVKEKDWLAVASIAGSAIAGWLITAFAIMLGAPFWFDLLNKFMQVRSTVKPDETAKKT